jgi:dTDP-glucose 4,6-dehydratase
MKKIVITGGAGFIGSHIVEKFADLYPQAQIVVLDKMTYAADIRNIDDLVRSNRVHLVVGDICDMATCLRVVDDADLVIHAAAESHVDNSFSSSMEFTRTNTLGTHCLMEACRVSEVPKIIHVSTDEVYGEIREGSVDETTNLNPTNPYSASKAAAEMIISGYRQSFKLPVVTLRANNIFGIRQFPEKIIPRFIMLVMTGQKLTIHGTGEYSRHYLSAHDLTNALHVLVTKGVLGEKYNIGTTEEYTNLTMAKMICDIFGVPVAENLIHVNDRLFNDARYAINWDKIAGLGWKPQHSLKDELGSIARWYADNHSRYDGFGPLRRRPTINS